VAREGTSCRDRTLANGGKSSILKRRRNRSTRVTRWSRLLVAPGTTGSGLTDKAIVMRKLSAVIGARDTSIDR
jgi:hypothetical protein